jgi:hypothetical protein
VLRGHAVFELDGDRPPTPRTAPSRSRVESAQAHYLKTRVRVWFLALGGAHRIAPLWRPSHGQAA